jgi:signal transduction histidine kinase
MSWWRTLRGRLAASYLAVVAVGAVTLAVVASLAAPGYFDRHMGRMGRGMGMMADVQADIDAAFTSSLRQAIAVGLVVSLLVAIALAAIMARRVTRPIDSVRRAARRLADGDYAQRVPIPAEEELKALAVDVNALAAGLEDTERTRLRLIGDLSHELRTPLSTIKGYMEGLIDGVIPADVETFASVAEEAARLDRLTEDLSTLSRVQEGFAAREILAVDLGGLAGAVASRLRPQFDDQGVTLGVDVVELPVMGDADRLTQVIVNLLGNALSHTPSGGAVQISGRVHSDSVELSVVDSGSGIDPIDLPRIFERFYRGGRSSGAGTGIGLTIARAIVRAHDGDVTAHSDGPGLGARFTLRLPRR